MTTSRIIGTCLGLCFLMCAFGGLFVAYKAGTRARGSVLRITEADQRLQKSAKVAQLLLPKFETRLAHPEAGDRFAIKVRFKTPVGPEYLWLKDPARKGSVFTGTLDQKPIALESHKGDPMTVSESDIYDWIIKRSDGSQTGGFTEIALSPDSSR